MNKIFHKPNIMISKCLNFDNCKFDGTKVNDDFLKNLEKYVNFIPICPDLEVGLGVPRNKSRLTITENEELKLIQDNSGIDLTDYINEFSQSFFKKIEDIDGFILKSNSGVCGIKDTDIYSINNKIIEKNGTGIFGQYVLDNFFNYPIITEKLLNDINLKEEFLTKIFCLAEFRELKKTYKIYLLSDFQARNKYLFMSYSPSIQVLLGQIIASYNKANIEHIYSFYYKKLLELFNIKTNKSKKINVCIHIFKYFKDECSKEEKDIFLKTIDFYKEGKISESSIISVLKAFAVRYKNQYFLNQTILESFPLELVK